MNTFIFNHQTSTNNHQSIAFWNLIISISSRTAKLCLFIGACLLVIPTKQISAQELSLVVSPPNTMIDGKPGEVVQKNIKITNNSEDQELILKVHVKNFIVQDDLGTPVLVDDKVSGRYLASPWFTTEKSELVIPAKTTERLVVIITIPSDALPGGHYAGVFFEPVPARNLKSTVSYTSAQVGSLFSITIPGDIKYDALIKDFKTTNNVMEFGPVEFVANIENQSDAHISPSSNIVIHDMIGRKLTEIKLSDVNIFPFTSRNLKGTWNTTWGLGRYAATLTASYGPGLVASRTMYFWIMPYKLIAALLVVLMVLLVVIISIRRHLAHRQDNRDEEIDALKRKIVEMENKRT